MRYLKASHWCALALFFLVGHSSVRAACVNELSAGDADNPPIRVKIWLPDAACDPKATPRVAFPLVLISHGTGGSWMGHADTAQALAQSGFIVAAPLHTGDNYLDSSYVARGLHLVSRPRQVSHVIDYLLADWPRHALIDPARIGMLGHSAGGFTALVIAGGEPDMNIGVRRCQDRPQAWDCQYLKQHGLDLQTRTTLPPQTWVHDPRVKALVIAAPCCGWMFQPKGLATVLVPIALWDARQDLIVEDSPAVIHDLLPAPPTEHVLANAGHFSFLAPCDTGMKAYFAQAPDRGQPDICADPVGFDRGAFHEQFNADVVAFFSKAL